LGCFGKLLLFDRQNGYRRLWSRFSQVSRPRSEVPHWCRNVWW
jgi:hypothetical protein